MILSKSKSKIFLIRSIGNSKKQGISSDNIEDLNSFWNQTFDKGRLKIFVLWFLKKYGEHKTIKLVEELKNIGFQYATKAGVSLGIEDLKIPTKKYALIMEAEQLSFATIKQYKRGEITGVERFQRLIDTWHRTSERLKQEVIDNFESTDILNPVYMMAFSGARGNISQVRQLVGMRGLMSDPQGQIIDFPIRSNFREGLTLTEYIISSYGARKGIVDTALRTANAGYLTRRLVDVAQHVIISSFDCGTKRGIFLTDMKEGNKTIYSLQNRLIGRVLARDIYTSQKVKVATRNTEISAELAASIALLSKKVFVRSTLTCQTKKLVCQLCYGWSLAQGNLVSIGEAVGVVAAQSIGEPGTQLTMRTFHTGGVFSGDVSDQIRAPFNGFIEYKNPIAGTLIRTPEGKIAFLTKNEGSFMVHNNTYTETKKFKIPFYTLLFLRNGSPTEEKEVIAQISSINRQKNATDQAELTIKAELSGQFYSKSIALKENKVGPKLKNSSDKDRIAEDQFNENAVDTVFEAWGWGYTWVLSGKIYQLGLPSNIFPIFGDYVNKKTYMNKINWIIPSSFGSSFNLNAPNRNEIFNKTDVKTLNIRTFAANKGIQSKFANKKSGISHHSQGTSSNLNRKAEIFLKNELVSFHLSKILYKKRGYFLKLSEPVSSFSIRSRDFKHYFKNEIRDSHPIHEQKSILSSKDSLFLLSSMFNDPSISKNTYPANWKSSFDLFLNWFPNRLSTATGGLIFLEPINSLKNCAPSQSMSSLKVLRHKSHLKNIIFKSGDLTSPSKNYKFYGLDSSQSNKSVKKSNEINNFNLCSLNSVKRQEWAKNKEMNFSNFNSLSSELNSSMSHSEFSDQQTNKLKNKQKVQYFPTFLRRNYLSRFQMVTTGTQKDNLRNKTLSNSSLDHQLASSGSFIDFKSKQINSNFNKNTNTQELLKKLYRKNNKLIREQYTQNQFDTILHTGLNINKNKTKTEIFSFGLNWKNAFNLNTNFISTQPFNNKLGLNKLSNLGVKFGNEKQKDFFKAKDRWNQTVGFQRIFWVSQPFYTISIKKAQKIYFATNPLDKLENKSFKTDLFNSNNFRNRFYSSSFNRSKNESSLFQISRQGKFKSLILSEGYVETNKNPYLIQNLNETQHIKNELFQLAQFLSKNWTTHQKSSPPEQSLTPSLSVSGISAERPATLGINLNLKTKESVVSSLFYLIFKKEGCYSFNSFNQTLLNQLKSRKMVMNNFLPSSDSRILKTLKSNNFSVIQKNINLKEKQANKINLSFITLKNFSKISSVPYFLNKTSSNFLRKKLNHKLNQSTSTFSDLFNIYFFTLFNKKFKQNKIFTHDHFIKSIRFKNKNFKIISSVYLNDKLNFSVLKLNELPGLTKTTVALPDVDFTYKQFYIQYYLSNYYYGFKTIKNVLTTSDLSLLKLQSENTCSERIENMKVWVNKSKLFKKIYLKTLLKTSKKLYFNCFKGDFLQKQLFKSKLLRGFVPLSPVRSNTSYLKPTKNKSNLKSTIQNKKTSVMSMNLNAKSAKRPVHLLSNTQPYISDRIKKDKIPNKHLFNFIIKTGWVYFTPHLVNFLKFNKQLIKPGKKIGDDFIFDRQSVFVEMVSFDQLKGYSYPIYKNTSSFHNTVDEGRETQAIPSYPQTVKNTKARFLPMPMSSFISDPKEYESNLKEDSYKGKGISPSFILIRKANEYKLVKDFDFKKEIQKLAHQKNQGPSLYLLNQEKNFINQSFNSSQLRGSYQRGDLNKQKITSQTLSKYPSPDLKLISNSSMYFSMDFMKNSLHSTHFVPTAQGVAQRGESAVSKQKKFSVYDSERSLSPITSLKPINFAPFLISYKAPYSLDFPFKTPLRLFASNDFLMDLASSSVAQSSLKSLLTYYLLKIQKPLLSPSFYSKVARFEKQEPNKVGHLVSTFSSFLGCPMVEYSLGKDFEKSISFPNSLSVSSHSKWRDLIFNLNSIHQKHSLSNIKGPVLGSLNKSFLPLSAAGIGKSTNESSLYKTKFVSFMNHKVNTQLPFIKTYSYSSFEGELIFKNFTSASLNRGSAESASSISNLGLQLDLFGENSIRHGCVILTKKDQIAFYFPVLSSPSLSPGASSLSSRSQEGATGMKKKVSQNYKENYFSLEKVKTQHNYQINEMIIHFVNMASTSSAQSSEVQGDENGGLENNVVQLSQLPAGMSQQRSKLLVGDFLVYGDQISPQIAVPKSGQLIHLNSQKITLRQGQPIFVSPKSILHKYDGDFIDQQSPVITLSYQQLKTGDIIQGIPKVEQFFEARTTKRGRLFRDSLSNLLKGLFKRYRSKLPLDQAVRQSFYKIQQIIVDGVQRVYRSQGVSIADKHLEVIVKQMTCKVRIIEGGQTGFFPGEVVDLDFVEQVNHLLMKKIVYEPLVLGITKSSLEVDSFLSAASFQQTTRVLSKSAISRKKDFLKGLKENVILGNLIPAGTGYLVYLDP